MLYYTVRVQRLIRVPLISSTSQNPYLFPSASLENLSTVLATLATSAPNSPANSKPGAAIKALDLGSGVTYKLRNACGDKDDGAPRGYTTT